MYKYRFERSVPNSCGFACQQKVRKNVFWPWFFHSEDGVVWLSVCVLTINSETDVWGLPSFASIRHRNLIIFESRKTLYLKETPVKLLKTYLKDNGNIYFVAI